MGKPAVALIAAGTVLLLILLAGNLLWWPDWLQPAGNLLYRLVYVAILPVHLVVSAFSPAVDFHWPMGNWVVSAYVTPALNWWMWRVYCRWRPKWRVLPHLWKRFGRKNARPREAPATSVGDDESSLTRRQVMAGAAWGTAWAAGAGLFAYSVAIEPARLRVRRYSVALPGLPEELVGLRMVQISDTHFGPFNSLRFLQEVIDRANRLEPDLVLLTGDYTHRSPLTIEPGISVFSRLSPRLGTLAVLGNHDHWEGAQACREVFRAIDIPLIDNARRFVTPSGMTSTPPAADQPALCMGGLGDFWEDAISFSSAFGGVPDAMPRILLSHNPDAAERVPLDMRVDLMVSGHTHGGQISIPAVGAPLVPSRHGAKYAGGMCRGPRCDVLVSRGAGMSILPLRFRVPPEISLLTLSAA